jgi:polyphosphate kinase
MPRDLKTMPPGELFFNRELSWLSFNQRVLEEAKDQSLPLLERLKFLCIFENNLDEFFMVRVARMRKQMAAGVRTAYPDGQTPGQIHAKVCEIVRKLSREHQHCLMGDVLPNLRDEGVVIHHYESLPDSEKKRLRKRFREEIAPVLTPLALDPGHPFPHLLDRGLNLILEIKRNPSAEKKAFAVLQIPPSLPRLLHVGKDQYSFEWVLLEELVKANVADLFPGYTILSCGPFRLTRNAELELEDEDQQLIDTVESALDQRPWSPAVRLEIPNDAAPDPIGLLCVDLALEETEIFRRDGLLDVNRLMVLTGLDIPRLRYPPHSPRAVSRSPGESIFRWIRGGDRLLHHPYDAYDLVPEFVQAAARDPKVLAIKQTLYRTSSDSPMVAALKLAAGNGKQVTVLVELKARFDEPHNIQIAREMEDAGVHVVYGIPGMKIHCKSTLVVRREDEVIRCYSHLGTGNYHPKTARIYTDFSLFTADPRVTQDVTELFNLLTGYSRFDRWKTLWVAPRHFRKPLLRLIKAEEDAAKAGKTARIAAKMNQLEDPEVIRALYRASQAGVSIDLVIRGFCCLRPEVPGLSENIRVRSVVGKFLEHSRIFHFHAGGEETTFIGSADWMPRNLDRRVESLVQILDSEVRERLLMEGLECSFAENVKTWNLRPDGSYVRSKPGKEPFASHELLASGKIPKRTRGCPLVRGVFPVGTSLPGKKNRGGTKSQGKKQSPGAHT